MNFRKLVCPKCSYWKIYVTVTFPDTVAYKCPKCQVPLEPESREAPVTGA
jgi:DNA-directed RNA polymerase subunit RPC12/RpoP